MKQIKILVLLVLVLFLSGCWNYRELNEMAIAGSIGIDYNEEENMFIISAQILNPKKSSGGETSSGIDESPVIVYKHEDKTIHEALRNMIYESPKKLYIGHLESVIFGELVAEKYMIESLDFLFRDSESRKDFDLVVAVDSSAYDILQIIPPFETTPSANIMAIISSNSKYVGSITAITYDNFVSMLYKEGVEAVLPIIKKIRGSVKEGENIDNLKNSVTNTDFTLKELAVFKDAKMVGTLSEEESIGYNIIIGKMLEGVVSFDCNEDKDAASVEIIKLKPELKIKIKDNIPNVSINLSGVATVSEVNCKIDLSKQKGIDKITKLAEKKIKEIMESSIKKAINDFNSDIFGFGDYLNKNNHKYWEKNKDNWYEIFPNIKYKIKVKLNTPQKGSTVNTFKEKFYDKKK